MGDWGTSVFASDLAADVRGDWRNGLLDGEEPPALTERLLSEYEQARKDPDERAVFWIALAAAQMETGRLEDDVRDKALEIVGAGGDLQRWAEESPSLATRRQQVLARLAAKLRGPQPRPKKLRRPVPLGGEFAVGDVLRLRNEESKAEALAVVVDQTEDRSTRTSSPVIELLLWDGGELPSEAEMASLPCLHSAGIPPLVFVKPRPRQWVVVTPSKKQSFRPAFGERVARGVARKPASASQDWTTWESIVRNLGSEGHAMDIETTRSCLRPKGLRKLIRR